MSLKRFNAEVTEEKSGKKLLARVFLVDISYDGVGLFVSESLDPGERVSVQLYSRTNQHLLINGTVLWTAKQRESTNIIRSRPYPFRCGIQFDEMSQKAQRILKEFIENSFQ